MNGSATVREVGSDLVSRRSTPPVDRRNDYFKNISIHPSNRGPKSVLLRHIGGNRVYAEQEMRAVDAVERTERLLRGQSPWITVVGDLGSGSLERLVDAEPGEMFVVKHARFGPLAIGSIAYALAHLGTGNLTVVRGDVMGGVEKAEEIARALLTESETVNEVAGRGELTIVAAGICSKNGEIEAAKYIQKGTDGNREKWELIVEKNHALAKLGVLNMPRKREAIILGCPDSREVPTLIFQTPKIVSVRVAGNLPSQTTTGLFEEGAKMGIPLGAVMGHEECGVYVETIKAVLRGEMGRGETGVLTNKAMHPVLRTKPRGIGKGSKISKEQHDEWLENAIREGVIMGCWEIVGGSPLIHSLVESGKFAVVGYYHSLTTREVEVVWAMGMEIPTSGEIALAHEARSHGNL